MLSLCMALGALAIDLMLPAFPEIRADLGLAKGSPAVAGLVTFFLFGMALGQIPAGLLTDRFGRRVALQSALVGVLVMSVVAGLTPKLGVMLAVRLVWGMCAGAIRVIIMASVRDTFAGAAMAKEMSFVMAVFFLVPILAPSVGAVIVGAVNWRAAFLPAPVRPPCSSPGSPHDSPKHSVSKSVGPSRWTQLPMRQRPLVKVGGRCGCSFPTWC